MTISLSSLWVPNQNIYPVKALMQYTYTFIIIETNMHCVECSNSISSRRLPVEISVIVFCTLCLSYRICLRTRHRIRRYRLFCTVFVPTARTDGTRQIAHTVHDNKHIPPETRSSKPRARVLVVRHLKQYNTGLAFGFAWRVPSVFVPRHTARIYTHIMGWF